MEPISTAVLTASIKTAFDLIEKGINEKASAAVLRDHLVLTKERLAFIGEQVIVITDKISQLEQEKATAEQRLVQLEAELKAYREAEQFMEEQGAAFKRKPEGGYVLAVYCPNCHIVAPSSFDGTPYHCRQCKWSSNFLKEDIQAVMSALP